MMLLRPRWMAAVAATIGLSCGADPRAPAPSPVAACVPLPHPATLLPAPTGSVPCPAAEDLALIDAEMAVSFEGDVSAGSLACRASDGSRDLTQVQKNVYSTLLFMRGLAFDAALPWTNRSLYDWFRLEIRGLRIRTDIGYDACCDPQGVIGLLGTRVDESTIPAYLEIMIHEARHVHGGGHLCGTNDNKIADLGAYGVQYSLLTWLADHWPEATSAQRAYCLNRAAWLRSTAFCLECQ